MDGKFKKNLRRGRHIIVFGSTKQGKTCLKKHILQEDEYINIQCNNKWSITEINTNILKMAGYQIEASSKKTESGKSKVIASLKAKLPFFESGLGAEMESGESKEIEMKPLELDPEDVNDIINALKKVNFSKVIALDDFHYLKNEVQRDFSIELKAFHENSKLCFIVIGVWLDENKLVIYNGDLTGRVVSVNADLWTQDKLREVVHKGEDMLNVSFSKTFIDDLMDNCFENVYYVQEVCNRVCSECGIVETQEKTKTVGENSDAKQMIRDVVEESSGRYNNFIESYSTGFQDTELEMHRWLLYPILNATVDELSRGLKYRRIKEDIQKMHPKGKDLNPGNITQALKSVVTLQLSKKVVPIIIDYDETNLILHVVDRGFMIWVELQEKEDLLSLAGLTCVVNN